MARHCIAKNFNNFKKNNNKKKKKIKKKKKNKSMIFKITQVGKVIEERQDDGTKKVEYLVNFIGDNSQ